MEFDEISYVSQLKQRAKLYELDKGSEWKEKGVGIANITKNVFF